jgi:hypothetical protein
MWMTVQKYEKKNISVMKIQKRSVLVRRILIKIYKFVTMVY